MIKVRAIKDLEPGDLLLVENSSFYAGLVLKNTLVERSQDGWTRESIYQVDILWATGRLTSLPYDVQHTLQNTKVFKRAS